MAPSPKKNDRVRPESARREQVTGEPAGKIVPKPAHEKAAGSGLKVESSNVSVSHRKSTIPPISQPDNGSVDPGAGPSRGGAGISNPDNDRGMGGLDRRPTGSVRMNPRGLTAVFDMIIIELC